MDWDERWSAREHFRAGGRCDVCGHTEVDVVRGTARWEYTDDKVTERAVTSWTFMKRVLSMCKVWHPDHYGNEDGV